MNLKLIEKHLKNVSDKQIQRQIDILEENLVTIKSPGTTVIDLRMFRIVRANYQALIAILEKRSGLQMPSETKDSPD